MAERFDTVIIGGGQAGLAAGYHLTKAGREFVVLEANERIGDSWRKRWDSLRLFTPARFCHLPGLPFPGRAARFPTKDEMGDYLEDYARHFGMPVRTGVRVDHLSTDGDTYILSVGRRRIAADNVIVATGAHHAPKIPSFAADLGPHVRQLHSSAYRGPSQLQDGGVLVVGLGNSGAEIAYEVSRTHPTFVSGKPSAQLPIKHGENMGRFVFPVIRFMGHHVLTLRTPIGRKARPRFLTHAAPLIRVKTKDLTSAGVEPVGRTIGAKDGLPELDDGRVLDVANVIWCTGFKHMFGWIDLPIFDPDGQPLHRRGVVEAAPGLYFVGLVFQYAASSDVLPGVGRDAAYVVEHIASRRVERAADRVPAFP